MKRSLPVLSEHSLASVGASQIEISLRFNHQLLSDHQGTSCKSGCAHCCYHPVYLSAVEGVLLYRKIVSKGLWSPKFKSQILDHAHKTMDLPYEVWLLSMLPCPMLKTDTRTCMAYRDRPFACRITVSVGDPDACHPHRIVEASIVNKVDVTRDFYAAVSKVTKRHGIGVIIMPLSVALLIGESIDQGEVGLESADMEVLKRYVENYPT